MAEISRGTYKKIENLTEESSNINKELRCVFGSKFPEKTNTENRSSYSMNNSYEDTEQFIEDMFPVDIRYSLDIDCTVTQDGFRPKLLSLILKNKESQHLTVETPLCEPQFVLHRKVSHNFWINQFF